MFIRASWRSLVPKTSILIVFWVTDSFEKLMEAMKSLLRKMLLHFFAFVKTIFVYGG